ncbi:BCS1 N terminal-domain-containing protein [Fusarium venenatum]|uniref:BCS1 N terminal-domain-containing protein n=1 Tax=Fusarium venenatum TaxID=56646 RepID=UPI001D84497D|nr:BCS1 N terminal-domain-containing protein [Fusarium venenatum]
MPSSSRMQSRQSQPLAGRAINHLLEALLPGGGGITCVEFFAYIAPYLIQMATDAFYKQCVSTIEIQGHDEIFTYLMNWVAQNNKLSRHNHRLLASSSTSNELSRAMRGLPRSNEDNEEEDSSDDIDSSASLDVLRSKISLYNAQPLRWTPAIGTHWFWYENRPISFMRTSTGDSPMPFGISSGTIILSCLGRNPDILKRIIYNAHIEYLEKQRGRTSIFRPVKSHGQHCWAKSMSKPTRPMSTIALEEHIKRGLVKDLAHYLNPRTKKWYATRGIPYRRGYLFSGPPGTGKTSLALAAAGLMSLNIYMISLSSPNLSEDTLASLFQALPRTCLVLLEDIDAAGVVAKRVKEKKPKAESTGKPGLGYLPTSREPITLSILLNVLDGVAAQEGRVLVMTSNHTDNIDPALLRPGQVDYTIEFGLASFETIKQIFQLMYGTPYAESGVELVSEKIDALSIEFAQVIPEHTFTPAALQGYLLTHQDGPIKALADAGAWVEEQKRLEERAEENEKTEDKDESETDANEKADYKEKSEAKVKLNGGKPNGVATDIANGV